ncbi:tetratricopeptide repeat protein [Spirosoma sp. KCTC 42546]|uniref:tetratricopeptide repeat protein n=1 Tax=Spirosoma sp. KCTC 42546 TaxID=2520506 RepID=UPI001159E207|nr:tetratricopeptide repeat protein [Spirosoma sp. KCTC 42546]QDK81275.1 tetratricopeptide repeat protein [Spirosoma sp. KCTC 42546]
MQKNIVYGSIDAGGDVHIGDKIYIVERDFPHSILFLRIEKSPSGYDAMLSVKGPDDASIPLLLELVQLPVSSHLFEQVVDFQNLRRGIDQTMRQKSLATHSAQTLENGLSKVIYQSFFAGDIGVICTDFLNLLQSSKIRDLLLVISTDDEQIQNIPWEIVLPHLTVGNSDGLPRDNFSLVRSRERTLNGFNRQSPNTDAAPLKLLFIPALPENLPERSKLLEIEDEQRKIIEAVRGLEATGDQQPRLVMEILDCANLEEIQEALQKRSHDIVHISGHGAYVDAIKAGILYLENEEGDEQPTTGHQLGTILREFSSIKLLVLSACETAVGGSEGSTAEQMAAVGLPAVLAMRFSVTDNGARLFTETLYTRLAYGDTLTKAMHDARLALWKDVNKRRAEAPQLFTSAEWFTPVLYQNQAIGSLLKPGQYNSDTLNRFYPTTTFLAGTHTKFIGEGFIGRKRLLIQLRHCFKQGEHVCLHGLGGLGKTTTAEAFADLYRKRSGHDILIFRTGTEIQEAVILERIFERWKYTARPDEFRQQQLRAQLDDPKSSSIIKLQLLLNNCLKGHRNILIFDNFENVQADVEEVSRLIISSAELSAFIRYLLENAPQGCHILFTSRYKITDLIDLVTHLAVDKMTNAEQYRYVNYSKTLRKLSLQERVVLDRRIDGHPRALQFLEGLLRYTHTFNLPQFDALIGNVENRVFEDLMLDRLYRQLYEVEQNLFEVASVLVGRNPLAVLVSILKISIDELIPLVTALSACSLCAWDEKEQMLEVHALTREWMRKQEILPEKRFKELSFQAGLFFKGRPNLEDKFFAKTYFEQAQAWNEYALIFFQIVEYHELIGLYATSRELCLEILSKNISLKININALNILGQLCFKQSDYYKALNYYEKCLDIAQQIGDIQIEEAIYTNIGQVYATQGKYGLAREFFEKRLGIAKNLGNTKQIGILLNNLGQIHVDTKGDPKVALNYFEQSLHFRYLAKDLRGQSQTLNNIGQLHALNKNYMEAFPFFTQSLRLAQQISDVRGEARAIMNIGTYYQDQGNYEQAIVNYEKCYAIAKQIGDKMMEIHLLHNLGRAYLLQNNYKQAFINLSGSLHLSQQIGNQRSIGDTRYNLGWLHLRQYSFDQALIEFEESLNVRHQIGNIKDIADSTADLGVTYFYKDNLAMAIPLLAQAVEYYHKIGSRQEEERTSLLLSEIQEKIGEEGFNEILNSKK